MDKLLLIDGHSVAYRAFFALPVENFATSTGQATNAVFGFTSMLINVLRDEAPTHVCVAFDVSRKSFRTEEYPEYKGTRSASPPEFSGQVELIKEVLDALGIVHVQKEGYEADDLIATLARQAGEAAMESVIVTGDRDALQLVTDTTTVLYPKRGVSDLARMTPAAVEEKYGVTPARYPEIAALVGETSDNLPGVPGVGPKTAAKWINSFGGLDEILARVDDVPGKAGQSLRDHLDDVVRNRRLNALVADVDIDVEATGTSFSRDWDLEQIHQVFDALEFKALRDRLFEYLGGAETVEEAPTAHDVEVRVVNGSGELRGWLAGLDDLPIGVAVDVDAGQIIAGALSQGETVVAWAMDELAADDTAALLAFFSDTGRAKVVHDAKPLAKALLSANSQLAGLTADTALMAYLLRPDQRSYDFADLVMRHLQRSIDTQADNGQLSFDAVDEALPRLGAAATAVVELADVLGRDVQAEGEADLLAKVELPLLDVLANMEHCGIAVDSDKLDDLHQEFTSRMTEAARSAHDVIGREINLGSPKQLQALLFDELQMPKTKKIKTGYTTDAESLRGLYAKTNHPFLEHLLVHRDVTKQRQIVETLRKAVESDGRIHTVFSQTVAATGRLSSMDPNLQNIPIRQESGRRIRAAFTVQPPFDHLLTADYSQIEMRIMAHLSEDADLIEAFASGQDFHTFMAAKVFERDPADIDAELRARIKAMNYGLAYGLSSYGLGQQLGIGPQEAQVLMDDYFVTFGGVRDYLQTIVEQARAVGYTETILGRRRHLPDLHSSNRQRRDMAERMALNAPIQGSAADIIKVAMLNVDRALREAQMESRMLLQVHDELVFEVAPGEDEALEALVRRQMADAADLSVELSVSVGRGPNWHEAGH